MDTSDKQKRRMESLGTLLVVFLVALASFRAECPLRAADHPILVSAAVSLKEAFREIAGLYKQRTGAEVSFSFGASGALERQIEAGAPVDVFASAGEKEMQELEAKQLIDPSTKADFARNSLVLVVPRDSKLGLHSFADLERPQVKRIAIGNPKTVPAGRYAQQLLEKTGLWAKVESRLVLAETVRQVLDYADRGEVDAGVVYATDVALAHGRVAVVARASDADCGPILYPITVVKGSGNARAARKFVEFVLSPDGASILKKHGFLPAK